MTALASDSSRWYVVRAKARQECRADANLRGWGIETFMPRIREPRSARMSVEKPYGVTLLFPGYLFACFDAASLYSRVRFTRGVHSVVGFGECATPVEEAVMALVRSQIHDDGFVHLEEPRVGDIVQITNGPLRSLSGVFERDLNGSDRVLILLSSIGLCARIEVRRAFVRRAADAATAQKAGEFPELGSHRVW
jgi:transcription antitermination factor NusG